MLKPTSISGKVFPTPMGITVVFRGDTEAVNVEGDGVSIIS